MEKLVIINNSGTPQIENRRNNLANYFWPYLYSLISMTSRMIYSGLEKAVFRQLIYILPRCLNHWKHFNALVCTFSPHLIRWSVKGRSVSLTVVLVVDRYHLPLSQLSNRYSLTRLRISLTHFPLCLPSPQYFLTRKSFRRCLSIIFFIKCVLYL